MFSVVGYGNNAGVNNYLFNINKNDYAFFIFPVIFNLPLVIADADVNFPRHNASKLSSFI